MATRRLALPCAALLLAAGLAGCAGGRAEAGLAREIVIRIDPDTLSSIPRPDSLLPLANTTFVYTQGGGSLEAAEARARYTDAGGRERNEPLSAFTAQDRLRPGDQVRIPGVAVTSNLTIRDGKDVVAERRAGPADWLSAFGVPLPVAAGPGSLARYGYALNGSLSLGFDRAVLRAERDLEPQCHLEPPPEPEGGPRFVCEGETHETRTAEVRDLTLDGGIEAAGNITLKARQEGEGGLLGLRLNAEAVASGSLLFQANVSSQVHREGRVQESGEGRFGIDAGLEARVRVENGWGFRGGALARIGGGGAVHADGHLYLFNDTVSRQDRYEPPGISHPLADDVVPYEEEDLGPMGPVADPDVVRLLHGLYGLLLQEGDRLTFELDLPEGGAAGGAGMHFVYEMVVAGRQVRHVAAGTFDALKMQGSLRLATSRDGRATDVQATQFTYWVDGASYLPLQMEASFQRSMRAADLETVYRAMQGALAGEGIEVDLPDALTLVASGTARLEMVDALPGLRLAAPLHYVGTVGVPVVAAMAAFAAVGSLGADAGSDPEEPPAPPEDPSAA